MRTLARVCAILTLSLACLRNCGSVVVTEREAPYVTLETSMGKVVVELYWKHAPKTCQNFASLAARGYYNNTKFHRIIPGFMVQGGDPTATGKGGDSIYGQVASPRFHSTHAANTRRAEEGSTEAALPFRGVGARAPLSLQQHLTLNAQPPSVKAKGVTEI